MPSDDTVDVDVNHEHVTWATLDTDAVGRVARHVEIKAIQQVMSDTFLNPVLALGPPDPAWGRGVEFGFDAYKLSYDPDDQLVVATIVFGAMLGGGDSLAEGSEEANSENADSADDEPAGVLMDINVRFLVTYALDEPVDEVDVDHFCFFNGTFNAWPYWREFAQRTTLAMGLAPPLVVPVLPVPEID